MVDSAEQQQNYKKPCLISPRKTPSLDLNQSTTTNITNETNTKSLTISVNNSQNQINTTLISSSPSTKKDDCSLKQHQIKATDIIDSSSRVNFTANLAGYLCKIGVEGSLTNDKYWFSLNANLSTLMYWNDKYEQDLGKIPLGKYELNKCCQVNRDFTPTHQQQSFNSAGSSSCSSYHNHYQQMGTNGNDSLDFKITVC